MQIFVNPNYNFLRWRMPALVASLVFILAGVGLFATRGINLGIDFAGGADVILKFRDQVPLAALRSELADATIQQYGKEQEQSVLIRLSQQKTEGDYAGAVVARLHQRLNPDLGTKVDINLRGRDLIEGLLRETDPDRKGTNEQAAVYYKGIAEKVIARRSELGIFSSMDQVRAVPGLSANAARVLAERTAIGTFTVLNQETVGPQVGSELQTRAILAITLSVLAMGIYIAIRFDLKFGVAAVLCLVHDVAITLAFLLMINAEFEILTVASLLMVVGYSINDKVVIYDRVRENMRKATRGDFESVLNESLNQSLSRTILTGGCVILALVALILFGGKVINEFAWLLLIGILAGTYSTVTVAPAIVIAWNKLVGAKDTAPAAARAREEMRRTETTPARKRRAS